MEFHESALDAIYEDDVSCSDVEEGEIEGEEVQNLEPMDVDRGEARIIFEEGEISDDDDPSPGETCDGSNETREGLEPKDGNDQLAKGNNALGPDRSARPARRKKSKKKRSGKRKSVDEARFVRETCIHLQEKKISLIWALVKKLGVDAVRDLVNEVNVIEKCGGQFTNDKKRRRTPGGVLWNILRGRVQPEVYKEIMSQGNEVLKQKAKQAKESLKRQRMDVDEPSSMKRRKMDVKDADTLMATVNGRQLNQSTPIPKVRKDLQSLMDGPAGDDSLLPTVQLQKAWVEGIKKKDASIDVGIGTPSVVKYELGAFKDLKATERKPVDVVDRLRVPVEYSDLVTITHDEYCSVGSPEPRDSFR
ncbi:phosphorylated adapter RNA export protein [Marchantia polymorpha subsp. ruderalis]|uniref:Phosphorylated adapter RNA export protein n=2 Tax=Marchantia polymorpha TaxID=3197 RepID=A0A176W911_MARPO|nr:hypothetical protein AXG93_1433s1280 [Marchantia polymorpha subsp. ruderalis]PTQ33158.1 hypothetical protein MARPO_0091s0021 [Marchantia polymorpha]PTQ33159.1 hypothetical protein MARPO_0091s0021 [Marchantia polymorpha]BBN15655.1 hypothetical protein Mp_6g21340 [Marchantia polymorpha subsp. ruderalis]BBN15656.1 hypothetical protein Mp_6g21340 [Marchantia polymorpha subsp. ruderalis]|eukprot:PTQ33158.1 hypothetical protein MARPO_0091s0021 [Marchantia polymorpha]